MSIKIQLRRDTIANWTANNPLLAQGEPALNLDDGRVKYGNGVNNWIDLPYASSGVTDHGALTGLADDDHTQYHNDTRGDIRYYTKSQSDNSYEPKNSNIQSHISSISNPHSVTKNQVGLGNVPNLDTSTTANITDSANKRFVTDAEKTILSNTSGVNTGDQDLSGFPLSSNVVLKSAYTPSHSILAQQSGTGSPSSVSVGNNTLVGRKTGGGSSIEALSVSDVKSILNYTKSDVGLSNVDNTSDLNKPISTATQTALDAKQNSLGFTPANKAGDTFTGNVSIIKPSGNADFTIEAPLATDNKDISFKTNGLHRFIARVDGSTDDFTLRRHNDLGAHIDNPISVDRATGNVSIPVATSTTQAPNDNSTKIATTEYSDNSSKAAEKCIVRVYSSSVIWAKPANLKSAYVELCGGGGQAGSGRRGAASSVRCGGGGGAGGAVTRGVFTNTDLPATLNITVGAGGSSGGASITVDNTNGNPGANGGDTTFDSLLSAPGGGGGGGGTAISGSAGSVTFTNATPDNFVQKNGGGASAAGAAGVAGAPSFDISAPGGGGGGGITAANVLSNGAVGGGRSGVTYRSGFTATGGTPGLNGAGVGGQGGNGSPATATYFGLGVGSGGGGGGARSGAPSGNGGNGTGFGSGGGGGAASENGFNSGRGGNGGNGYCIVIEYY